MNSIANPVSFLADFVRSNSYKLEIQLVCHKTIIPELNLF